MGKAMKIYKITKHFRGGSTTYYAEMPEQAQMTRCGWEQQLDEWGEATPGGGEDGWHIYARKVKKIPTVRRPRPIGGLFGDVVVPQYVRKLEFSKDILESAKAKGRKKRKPALSSC